MNKVKQIIFAKEKRMISNMVDAFERENKDTVQMKISGTNVSISIEELLDYVMGRARSNGEGKEFYFESAKRLSSIISSNHSNNLYEYCDRLRSLFEYTFEECFEDVFESQDYYAIESQALKDKINELLDAINNLNQSDSIDLISLKKIEGIITSFNEMGDSEETSLPDDAFSKETMDVFIDNLTMKDMMKILNNLDKLNSLIGVDTELLFDCPECSEEIAATF